MIKRALDDKLLHRVHFVPVRDYFYNETAWQLEVQSGVAQITQGETSVCLMTHFKDASSYYQKDFPWDQVEIKGNHRTSATDTRDAIFSHNRPLELPKKGFDDGRSAWQINLPDAVAEYIRNWAAGEARGRLCDEYIKISEYKERWKGTPHPVTFVTVDALVLRGEQMLVVKRKFVPGKGLYALPGGFLRQNETIEDGIVRELREETRIAVPKPVLVRAIKQVRVFDYPGRDPRGRVITHCGIIDLGPGPLIYVKGDDDAERAAWLPCREVLENPRNFYADHAQIIYQLLLERKLSDKDRLLAEIRNSL